MQLDQLKGKMALEKGRIVERGMHEALLAAGGRDADLYHEITQLD